MVFSGLEAENTWKDQLQSYLSINEKLSNNAPFIMENKETTHRFFDDLQSDYIATLSLLKATKYVILTSQWLVDCGAITRDLLLKHHAA